MVPADPLWVGEPRTDSRDLLPTKREKQGNFTKILRKFQEPPSLRYRSEVHPAQESIAGDLQVS